MGQNNNSNKRPRYQQLDVVGEREQMSTSGLDRENKLSKTYRN